MACQNRFSGSKQSDRNKNNEMMAAVSRSRILNRWLLKYKIKPIKQKAPMKIFGKPLGIC
ncbi:hypothetical protein PCE01_00860 [Pediococcus cellicola]|nr:hypothetical protein PCE01_00860 [Pediococcus cellicola]